MKKIILSLILLIFITSCSSNSNNSSSVVNMKDCSKLEISDKISQIRDYCINKDKIYYKRCDVWIDWHHWEIFCNEKKIDADLLTFNIIDNVYSYDKNHLFKYWEEKEILIKNYKQFISLWDWYFKDDKYLYTDWFSLEYKWNNIVIYWELFTIWNKLYYRNIKWSNNQAFLIKKVNGELFNLVWKWLWYDNNHFIYTIRFNDSYYPAYISYIDWKFNDIKKTISDKVFQYNNWYVVCSNYWVRWCIRIEKGQKYYLEVSEILNKLSNWNITNNDWVYLDFLSKVTYEYSKQIINIVDDWNIIKGN